MPWGRRGIYVFSHEGRLRRGFPKFMAEIQGQVAVADVDEDGRPDLCAVDFRSNVACFDRDGGDVWDRQISAGAGVGGFREIASSTPPPCGTPL